MPFVVNFSPDGVSVNYEKRKTIERPEKGKSKVLFPSEYTVLDVETTGLDSYYDDIIEIFVYLSFF